jgi:hypothetical protein
MVNESANNAEEPGSSSPAEVILSQNPTQLLTASLSTGRGLCWLTATNGSNASRRGHEAEVLVDDLVPLLPTGRCTESHLIFATSLRTATKPPRASQPRVPRDLPLLTACGRYDAGGQPGQDKQWEMDMVTIGSFDTVVVSYIAFADGRSVAFRLLDES